MDDTDAKNETNGDGDAEVAVVGAGPSGLSAAYALGLDGADVSIYEKSGVLLGRGATREKDGCVYDYGANYIKAEDEGVNALLRETTDADGIVEVEGGVWTFDADGNVSEGYDEEVSKLTHRDGVSAFGEGVLEASGAELLRRTRVESVIPKEADEGVVVETEKDSHEHEAVVVTPPAPQTAALLEGSTPSVADAVAGVGYTTVLSVVLRYPFELEAPWYGLVNTDKEHDVGWLSREERKPGHVPDGSLLVVQASPGWSERHYDDGSAEFADALAEKAAELIDEPRLRSYEWYDHQRWRYSLPLDGVDDSVVESAADDNVYLAGDWTVGEGRLHAAFRSGLDVGERVADEL